MNRAILIDKKSHLRTRSSIGRSIRGDGKELLSDSAHGVLIGMPEKAEYGSVG